MHTNTDAGSQGEQAEPVQFKNKRLKLKISGKLLIILEESTEYNSNQKRKTRRCEHVTN